MIGISTITEKDFGLKRGNEYKITKELNNHYLLINDFGKEIKVANIFINLKKWIKNKY